MGARFFDSKLAPYRGPWPPFPGMYPVHVRDTGFVLELAVWDPDVSQRALCDDLAHMDPDTEPMLLTRVNFGTADEVADLVEMALPTKSVALDISGTKASTRRAFRDAFVARGIEMMKVVSE